MNPLKKNGSNNVNQTNKDNKQLNDMNNVQNNDNDSNDMSSSGSYKDQLDLGIGDIGYFDSTLGTYEITLDSAKVIKDKVDGVMPELGTFILLELTIKNTSETPLDIEEIIGSFEVTDDLDLTGYSDQAEYFDGIEKFTGTIEPGEVKKGNLFTDVYEGDTYYFTEDAGLVAGGVTNQVIWKFTAEEAQ